MNFINKGQIQSSQPTLLIRAKTSNALLDRAFSFKRFDTSLSMRYDEAASKELKKDYWRVLDDFKFYYGTEDEIKWAVVPAGFLTDGASVPRWFWGVIAPWGAYGQAAALHDYLIEYGAVYQDKQRININRKEADHVFNEALKVAQIPTWKRRLMFWAVRAWSRFGIRPSHKHVSRKRSLEAAWVREMNSF